MFTRKHDATRRLESTGCCPPPLFSHTHLPSAALAPMATQHSSDDPSSQVFIPAVLDPGPKVMTCAQTKGKHAEGEPTVPQPAEGAQYQSSNEKTDQNNIQNAHRRSPSSIANGRPADRPGNGSTASQGQDPAALASRPSTQDPAQQLTAGASSSTPVPLGDAADKPKDGDKDKGSLDTTLNTRTHSIRHKDAKSASEGAHTVSSTAEPPDSPRSKTKRARQSLFVKLFHVLVPCVGPSAKARFEDVKSHEHRRKDATSTVALKEKQAAKEAEELPPPPLAQEPASGASSDQPAPAEPAPTAQESMPTLNPLTIPPQVEDMTDPALIIPPTPTKSLLPPDETEGMTSGAVQPPGSTGEDVMHDQVLGRGRDSGDESDGSTSFTEDEELDEANAIDDIEDEEERLIMNGGAGIPVGPVSGCIFKTFDGSLT